jgi:hypothetical protein
MFQFTRHSEKLPFLHDQLFTLQWNIPRCKWILIHYVNSQRKPWYKRTERPYRFRRWFFRRAQGSFSNLANIREPRITVYVFRFLISFPRKVVIPLRIGRMDINQNLLTTVIPDVHHQVSKPILQQHALSVMHVSPALSNLNLDLSASAPHLNISSPDINTECSWPVADWIEQGILHKDNLHLLQHPENLPYHA